AVHELRAELDGTAIRAPREHAATDAVARLQHDHACPGCAQCACGREAGGPRTDDHDVRALAHESSMMRYTRPSDDSTYTSRAASSPNERTFPIEPNCHCRASRTAPSHRKLRTQPAQ